jgi:hypothetical protein
MSQIIRSRFAWRTVILGVGVGAFVGGAVSFNAPKAEAQDRPTLASLQAQINTLLTTVAALQTEVNNRVKYNDTNPVTLASLTTTSAIDAQAGVKLGNNGGSATSETAGLLRWNTAAPTNQGLQFSDGTAWRPINVVNPIFQSLNASSINSSVISSGSINSGNISASSSVNAGSINASQITANGMLRIPAFNGSATGPGCLAYSGGQFLYFNGSSWRPVFVQ